ncbi:MAG: 23S rRNA (pseudouridine(1915)-N(3))-methyltransferase RlmH [Bacteriovoracaceae bacterium]|jgi:23S rRNA (pseudouridine1915-N3)-methyltransferase|nr:23S rRNA (pseudouridine(1915)-N(3))-methyltransferase RlmH [Bacteriovoracaceae bacterium]
MATNCHLIVVGKLKSKELEAIENDYLKRISNPNLKIHEVKASADNKDQEGKSVLKKALDISKGSAYQLIIMSEWGVEYTSKDFSKFVFNKLEDQRPLIFVICGAEGPSDELINESTGKLSLSKLTFPHKIARVLFVEQFYRAITIKNNHPYHN